MVGSVTDDHLVSPETGVGAAQYRGLSAERSRAGDRRHVRCLGPMVLRLLVVHVTLQGLLLGTAVSSLLASARAGASQHNAVRAAGSDRAAHVHRQRAPAVFVRRTLDVGSARRHAPARRIRMSGTVCHTRCRRRRPDVPSAYPLSRSRTSGRLRYRHELPALPVHDVVCHARPHLLSGALGLARIQLSLFAGGAVADCGRSPSSSAPR